MKKLDILKKENFNKLTVVIISVFVIVIGLVLFLRDGEDTVSARTFKRIYNDMQISEVESYNSNFRITINREVSSANISNYNDEQIVIRSYNKLADDFIGSGIVYEEGKFYRERVSDDDFEPGLYREIDMDFNYLNPLKLLTGLNYIESVEEVLNHNLGEDIQVYEVVFSGDGIEEMLTYFGYEDVSVSDQVSGKIHLADGLVDTITYTDDEVNIRATFHSFGSVRKTTVN